MEYFSQIIKSQRAKQSLTALNLLGLSVCIGSALLILFYVRFELSFDTFHDDDRIYRVESRLYEGNVLTDNWATTTFGHAPVMFREIPGIEQYVRVTAQDREQARHAGGAVAGRRTLSADDSGRRIHGPGRKLHRYVGGAGAGSRRRRPLRAGRASCGTHSTAQEPLSL